MNFPDWTLGGRRHAAAGLRRGRRDAVPAGRRREGRREALPVRGAAPIALPAGKTLTGVVMPDQPGTRKDQGRVHVFGIADDGTAPRRHWRWHRRRTPTATTGQAATVDLGTATGGERPTYSARVQWGDASVTEDATVDPSGAISGATPGRRRAPTPCTSRCPTTRPA